MRLFDINISDASREETLTQVSYFLAEQKFHRIATVNPEFLVLAEKHPEFKETLLAADLCIADGFGVVLAGWLQGKKVTRFPGADLLYEILTIAERDGYSVFLAIRQDGLSSYEEIRVALLKIFPKLVIVGADVDAESRDNSLLKALHSVLFLCNFGAPSQELFLENLRNVPSDVRLALGVGGAFDFLTGKVKRAPSCLRRSGFEWLWRFILQPRRFKRIWTAVVIFPWCVVCSWQNSKKRV